MAKSDLTVTKIAAVAGVSLMTALAASGAHAATTSQTQSFNLNCEGNDTTPCTDSAFLDYDAFDSTQGTLTDVTLSLNSLIFSEYGVTASIQHLMTEVDSISGFVFDYSFTGLDLDDIFGLASFIDSGPRTFGLLFDAGNSFFADWGGFDGGSLTLTYEYDDSSTGPHSEVPLPASLGFLAFAMGGLGMAARKRKAR